MTTTLPTPIPPATTPRAGLGQLLHAEWTKFRTVRGWVIGALVAVLVTIAIGVLGPVGSHVNVSCLAPPGKTCTTNHNPTLGPDGQPVSDAAYLAYQQLTGDGSITARLTGLTGQYVTGNAPVGQSGANATVGTQPWSKAGIIIKNGTSAGSSYAAMMITGGNGVRMQDNYTHDTAGIPGPATADQPRWLRLTRTGDTITGADSTDGTNWTTVGTATLTGLPITVHIGLFAASPDHTVSIDGFGGVSGSGGPSEATGQFDNVNLKGNTDNTWTGPNTAGNQRPLTGLGYQRDGDQFTVTGSGDIAPVPAGQGGLGKTITDALVGAFAGLLAIIVIATLFITAEYRRGLIRTTLAASPRRGRVLATKATVIGAISFATGALGAAIAIPIVTAIDHAKNFDVFPHSTLTDVRIVLGTGALFALAAILALAIGTILRRSAGAVAIVIVAIVLPYILAVSSVLPAGVADWLLRITPAAGFAIQQSATQYPQVLADYAPNNGYFPLSPIGGLAVLTGYAAIALIVATQLLKRRDA